MTTKDSYSAIFNLFKKGMESLKLFSFLKGY
jgi:hypothetical protein